MSKLILSLLIGSLFLSACRKESFVAPPLPVATCQLQTVDPTGRSYDASAIVSYNCTDKHCGSLPLSIKNYWVYEDSIFSNGNFVRVQFDTLRYTSTKMSMTDGLVWWSGNVQVGLPTLIYTNESAFFTLADRLFTPDVIDAKKDFLLPEEDSVKYLTSFEDMAANGRSVKLSEPVSTSMGEFSGCILLEKNARYFRRDQVIFKPGFGVIKYTQEKAPIGDRNLKIQQVSTLIAVHIE